MANFILDESNQRHLLCLADLGRRFALLSLPTWNSEMKVLSDLYKEIHGYWRFSKSARAYIGESRQDVGALRIVQNYTQPYSVAAFYQQAVYNGCIRVNGIACELAACRDMYRALVCAETIMTEAKELMEDVMRYRYIHEQTKVAPSFLAVFSEDFIADLKAPLQEFASRKPEPALLRYVQSVAKSGEFNVLYHDCVVTAGAFLAMLFNEEKPRSISEWKNIINYIYKWVKLQPRQFDPVLRARLIHECKVLNHHRPQTGEATSRLHELLSAPIECLPEERTQVNVPTLLHSTQGSYFTLLPTDLLPELCYMCSASQLDHLSMQPFVPLLDLVLDYTPNEWSNALYRLFYEQLHNTDNSVVHRWQWYPTYGLQQLGDLCTLLRAFLRASIYLCNEDIHVRLLNLWMRVAQLSTEMNDYISIAILYEQLTVPVGRAHKLVDQRVLQRYTTDRKWVSLPTEYKRRMQEVASLAPQWFLPDIYSDRQQSDDERTAVLRMWQAFKRCSRLPAPNDREVHLAALFRNHAVSMPKPLLDRLTAGKHLPWN